VDQFNSIHDKLVAKFKELKDYFHAGPVHFAAMETWEDFMTIQYLRDCAEQAGVKTVSMKMAEVGWDSVDNCFVDLELRRIRNIFKLYPWEWLVHEEYGQHLLETADQMHWMEPAWKMLLSNKGILPILWELFPNHPNLLPTYFNPDSLARYAKKPLLSREGANVTLVTEGQTYRTQGDYGEEGYIYQVLAPLPNFNGNYPVIGSWVIDQESAGIGIRESNGLITDNLSRFVPHIMKG
jgi:glutathionylspermidine synthase